MKSLKALSKAREATWDNTTAGEREKKIKNREDRLFRLEEARKVIDREEEQHAANRRKQQIDRANTLLENGSDLMKQVIKEII